MPAISPKDPDRQVKYYQQIRAVFRAASHGEPGILFPMITSVPEARKILAACDDAKMKLRAEGVKCSENVKIGFMVEIPAAAIISDCLAPMADFFIIDSDSIARHTLACYEEDCFSPDFADGQLEAVMRLIGNSARNAVKNGARIGICGSLAGDTSLTGDFLRMGIDNFCVTPDRLAEVRKRVTEVDLEV
ncbi:MAG: putative PEP-binding protein [Oscillospiraceae bacterium]